MRQIKFRAWEKYDTDYSQETGVTGEMYYSNAWPDEELQDKRTIVISGFYHDSGWSSEDFTVMQSTGLRDKHGKEIYEGDVVGYVTYLGTHGHEDGAYDEYDGGKVLIEWDAEKARFKSPFSETENLPLQLIRGSFEVIGNIYENPELLEQKRQ